MNLSADKAVIATLISAAVIFATRAFPFILFSKKQPPSFIRFIEKYIPPMIMAILLVYCMKDVNFVKSPFGLPQTLSLALTLILHLWKNNSMLSIFGGTIAFMVLQRIF